MTGSRTMSAESIIKYFDPLITWLKDQNKNECFGWGYQWPDEVMKTLNPKRCPADDPVDDYLEGYNQKAAKQYNQFVWAEWNFWLNITDETQRALDQASVAKDAFDNKEMLEVKKLDISRVTDPVKKRQLNKIGAVDLSFNDSDSETFHNFVSSMTNIYSTAFVCNQSTPNCDNSTGEYERSLYFGIYECKVCRTILHYLL